MYTPMTTASLRRIGRISTFVAVLAATAATVALVPLAGAAFGQTAPAVANPAVAPSGFATVIADFEAKGYRLLDIDSEHGTLVEIDAINPAGQRVEIYVDTATGQILAQHIESQGSDWLGFDD